MDTKNSTQKTKREDAERSGVPRSKIPELRREQILEAALKVFALKGADGATNQDIAKEAGLASPGLIYHYFQDRSDLLKQVIIKYHPINMIFSDRPADQETDLYGELLHIASATYSFKENRAQCSCFRILISELLKNNGGDDLFYALPHKVIQHLSRLFEKAKADKLVADLPTDLLVCNFIGAVVYPVLLKTIFNQDMDVKPEQQVETFLKGVLP